MDKILPGFAKVKVADPPTMLDTKRKKAVPRLRRDPEWRKTKDMVDDRKEGPEERKEKADGQEIRTDSPRTDPRRADSRHDATQSIEAAILQLAERGKNANPDFYHDVLRYFQRGDDPKIHSQRLVEVLIQYYEYQWRLIEVSRRREQDLILEVRRLTAQNDANDGARQKQREEPTVPVETVDMVKKLSEGIERLKSENKELEMLFGHDLHRIEEEHKIEGEKRKREFNTRLTAAHEKHDWETKELKTSFQKEIAETKERMSEVEQCHEDEIKSLQIEMDKTTHDLKSSHISMIENLRVEREQTRKVHDVTIYELTAVHAEREEDLKHEIAQQMTKYEASLAKMSTSLAQRDEDRKKESQAMEEALEIAKQELKMQFEMKKVHVSTASQDKIQRLQEDIKAYSVALLARDSFRPISEDEIRIKFNDLAADIKALAKLDWKADQNVCDIQIVERLSKNPRLFKMQILQVVIWEVLHKKMLCSPFRSLGEEGEILELMWNEAYGVDPKFKNNHYTWPKPELEVERWRYINVKECHQALRQPISSEWDPRSKLKIGFRTSLDEIREAFSSTAGELVELEKNHLQAMDKIAKKAAILWLELGMQRCRFVVGFGLSDLEPVVERVQKAIDEGLSMVVVPELKRFGNLQGLDLDMEAAVSGCSGERVELPAKSKN